MTAPTTSADQRLGTAYPERVAHLQASAQAAATAPGTRVRLTADGCYWHAGTWRIFPGTVDQVARVRRYVRSEFAGHPALDSAMLAASELATNAITHTASGYPGGMFAVHLTQASPHHIAVLVTDQGGPNHPHIGQAAIDQETGRGLQVIAAIASQLISTGDANGRSVLAVIPDPADDTALRLEHPR